MLHRSRRDRGARYGTGRTGYEIAVGRGGDAYPRGLIPERVGVEHIRIPGSIAGRDIIAKNPGLFHGTIHPIALALSSYIFQYETQILSDIKTRELTFSDTWLCV